MHPWLYIVYIVAVFGSAFLTSTLASYAWQRRDRHRATTFIALMINASLWSFLCILPLLCPTPESSLFWIKLRYLPMVSLPVIWVLFSLQYATYINTRDTIWYAILLSLIPMLTVIFIWTNEFHGLFWQSRRYYTEGPFQLSFAQFGPWFTVHVTYSYLLMTVGLLLLLRSIRYTVKFYRRQAIAMFWGALIPFFMAGFSSFKLTVLDFTPIGLAASGVLFGISLYRYELLNLKPIAREQVIDKMSDGMLVFNTQNYIVDTNPAAQQMFSFSGEKLIGRHISKIPHPWQVLFTVCNQKQKKQIDISITKNDICRYYNVKTSSLTDNTGVLTGTLIVWHDITARKNAVREKEALIAELQDALKQVKTLSGLLPICASCKKIRDDAGYWHQVEDYIHTHSNADFSHSICPDCGEQLYGHLFLEEENTQSRTTP